MPLHVLLLP